MAAVFFVTANFADESYIATEVNYAIAEKRKKGRQFSIITLVLDPAAEDRVPSLLHQYVWKQPKTHIEGLREILRALPAAVGPISWRE